MPLPKTPQEITIEYLLAALQDYEWSKFIETFDFVANPLQGATSNGYICTITYKNSMPSDVLAPKELFFKFAKIETSNNAATISRDHLVNANAYKKELGFYDFLLQTKSPLLQANAFPVVYYAAIDKQEKDQFLIIMQRGADPLDQLKGCSDNQCRSVAKQWAKVQAAFWYDAANEVEHFAHLSKHGLDQLANLSANIQGVINPTKQYDAQEFKQDILAKWDEKIEVMMQTCKQLKLDELEQDMVKVKSMLSMEHMPAVLDDAININFVPKYRTIVHGDFRVDNMLALGDDFVQIIDFQGIAFGNGCFDVAQFLSMCMSPKQFDEMGDEFIDLYWQSLIASNPSIAKQITLEQLKSDTHKTIVVQLSYLVWAYGSMFKSLNDNGLDIKQTCGRNFDSMIVLMQRSIHSALKSYKQ